MNQTGFPRGCRKDIDRNNTEILSSCPEGWSDYHMNRCTVITGRKANAAPAHVLVAITIIAVAVTSRAGPIIDSPETWTNSGVQGWINNMPDVTLANPAGGSNGFLIITFLDQGSPPVGSADDIIYTTTNTFTGNFIASNAGGASFTFLASNVTPLSVDLVFSVATNTHEWSSPLAPSVLGTWTSYSIPFDFALWSLNPGGTQGEFLADLQAVEWIGLHIFRGDTIEQIYGLDNFMLYLVIPEPADICLLAAGLLGLGLTFRRRVLTRNRPLTNPV